jgi:hypothetical protein
VRIPRATNRVHVMAILVFIFSGGGFGFNFRGHEVGCGGVENRLLAPLDK